MEQTIKFGDAATYQIGNDYYPGYVADIQRNGKTIVVNLAQGRTETFTLRQNGKYRLKGENFGLLHIGVHEHRLDPHF